MSQRREIVSGWQLAEPSDQPKSLRSPQARNLLQFSQFAGLEEGPPSTKGRFRRVNTTVSGSNGPGQLTNLTSRQLSQMSSSDSGEGAGPSVPLHQNYTTLSAGEQKLGEKPGEQKPGEQDNTTRVEKPCKKDSTPDSIGNGGFSNSLTISLDESALQGKSSTPRSGRRWEGSEAELGSDMEPSQISAHSKLVTSEQNCVQSMAGTGAEESGFANGVLREVTATLTKSLSQERGMIRKISGFLSRSKPMSQVGSQPMSKVDADEGTGVRDAKMEQGIPVRKGSLLGILGRKEKLLANSAMTPQRKRSFMRSPRRKDAKTKSADFGARTEDNTLCEDSLLKKETETTAADINFGYRGGEVADDDEATTTEDYPSKRAVEIEKLLNSVAL